MEGEDSGPHTAPPPGRGDSFIVGMSLTIGKLMTRHNHVGGEWKDCRPSVMEFNFCRQLILDLDDGVPSFNHRGWKKMNKSSLPPTSIHDKSDLPSLNLVKTTVTLLTSTSVMVW